MSDTHEKWNPIEESNNKYSISDMGRVKNNITGNMLKPIENRKGYVKVNLHLEHGERLNRQIHRLVAIAFIPNPENKPEVNHKNGIKNDNRVDNLEWVTGEENIRHAYETGLVRHKDERYSGYLYGLWKRNRKLKFCEEWQDYLRFYEWCYINGYSDGKTVCRYSTRKIFDPSNCYISTEIQHSMIPKEKRKRSFMCFGQLMTIEEISEKFDIRTETFMCRLKKGMSIEDAATKPLEKPGRPRREVLCEQQTTKKITTCVSA